MIGTHDDDWRADLRTSWLIDSRDGLDWTTIPVMGAELDHQHIGCSGRAITDSTTIRWSSPYDEDDPTLGISYHLCDADYCHIHEPNPLGQHITRSVLGAHAVPLDACGPIAVGILDSTKIAYVPGSYDRLLYPLMDGYREWLEHQLGMPRAYRARARLDRMAEQ